MDWSTLAALPVLALVDSTSVGTLLLPAWLLLAPTIRPRAVLGYLAVVAVVYWLLGLALLAGADVVVEAVSGASDGGGADRPRAVLVAQLVVGVLLLAWALLPERWRRRLGRRRSPAVDVADGAADAGRQEAQGGTFAPAPAHAPSAPTGRLVRWRDRAAEGGSPTGLLALAAVAVLLEAATMLPYLGAVTLLASTPLATGTQVLVLVGYCLVMVLPALLLVAFRVLAAKRVEPLLRRLEGWSRRAGGEAVLWVAAIAGFLLARDAAVALRLF
ncbi:GAP family protein [Aquipuribacter hungaricus]|uniref:GAP family protein n=1 Tax=Aquipuribacter hungaricus TaxID=545624 RepID=A0ABV7WHS0_9MICO